MSGCRIGKIRMKAGGAEVHRLPLSDKDRVQRLMAEKAAKLASLYKPGEMVGYVVFGWDINGYHSTAYLIEEKSPIGLTLLPAYISDALRRRMIEEGDWES